MKWSLSIILAGILPAVPAAAQTALEDRVYTADQYSNTVSVTDPAARRLVGIIPLGEPQPANLSPLYRGQLLVHGLAASPDGRTLAAVSIGSNSATFIDTATNTIRGVVYLGRSPHEPTFTPDGREVWVTVRGEDYVAVLDPNSLRETARIPTYAGPGMVAFSPDGVFAYVCSSFTAQVLVLRVRNRQAVGGVAQSSPFCPNIAATPDGRQVWFTLKDVGKVVAFEARPPFRILKEIDVGPLANHVGFARTPRGLLAYVTAGGRNEVQVYRTNDFSRVATIRVGDMPHGLFPSPDGSRIYVGLENESRLAVIDTGAQAVVGHIPVGDAPQAVVYIPRSASDDARGLAQLKPRPRPVMLHLARPNDPSARSSVSLFDQGLTQVLQASVTGLEPGQSYVLALARTPRGEGPLEPLAAFRANPRGAAVVNAVGPIRQLVRAPTAGERRYLAIAAGVPSSIGPIAQLQVE